MLKKTLLTITVFLLLIVCVIIYFINYNTTTSPPVKIPVQTSSQSIISMLDGKGKAEIFHEGDTAVSAPGTWKIVYVVDKPGISRGGGVAFHIPAFWGWTSPQNSSPELPGYVTVSCSNNEAKLDITINAQLNYAVVRTTNSKLAFGDTITLMYGDTQNGKYPGAKASADRYAEDRERFFVKVDGNGDGHFFSIDNQPEVNILPGPPARLIVTSPSIVVEGVPFLINVAVIDHMDNWIKAYNGSVDLLSSSESSIIKKLADSHIKTFECLLKQVGIYHFTANDYTNNLSGISNPVLCKKKMPALKLFWGDIHGHSQLSDGTGTADDYFSYARYVSGLHAAALTDHDAHGFEALDEHAKIWTSIKDSANRFNDPGKFVTLIGYEWTSWTYGHKHVLFFEEPAPVFSFRDPSSDSPDKLWKLLGNYNAITISHHVGGGPVAADWDFYNPDIEPLVEICSIHGNSESSDCLYRIYNPKKGSFVQDALSKGYKLGIVASGDTHNGHPGMGDPSAKTGGIVALYAENLTREALFDALKKRRVYGTSGDRIILEFRINGHCMGEIVTIHNDTEREIYIKTIGTDKLKHVEIIKNNHTLKSWEETTEEAEHFFKDPDSSSGFDFYYARVIQENGQMAWSSPIWFEKR